MDQLDILFQMGTLSLLNAIHQQNMIVLMSALLVVFSAGSIRRREQFWRTCYQFKNTLVLLTLTLSGMVLLISAAARIQLSVMATDKNWLMDAVGIETIMSGTFIFQLMILLSASLSYFISDILHKREQYGREDDNG